MLSKHATLALASPLFFSHTARLGTQRQEDFIKKFSEMPLQWRQQKTFFPLESLFSNIEIQFERERFGSLLY
jgi:hypothetical protein